jgi:hypothetical protein
MTWMFPWVSTVPPMTAAPSSPGLSPSAIWMLPPSRRIAISIGDEWEVYDPKVNAKKLRLSGGDLQEAITLRRVGPPTPRATGMAVPAAPPED